LERAIDVLLDAGIRRDLFFQGFELFDGALGIEAGFELVAFGEELDFGFELRRKGILGRLLDWGCFRKRSLGGSWRRRRADVGGRGRGSGGRRLAVGHGRRIADVGSGGRFGGGGLRLRCRSGFGGGNVFLRVRFYGLGGFGGLGGFDGIGGFGDAFGGF